MYYYHKPTNRFSEINRETRSRYRSVQSAKKHILSFLWLNENIDFKIQKEKDCYKIIFNEFQESPFLENITIKGCSVKFVNLNKGQGSSEIINKDEYNKLFLKKLTRMSDEIQQYRERNNKW